MFATRGIGICGLSLILALTSGCATMDSMMGGGSASADPRLQNEAEFFSRSGIEACLAGAAGAVLIKKIADAIDDDKKDKDKKFFDKETLLIAVGVCGVAMGANYYLETRRSQYANREQALNEMVKDAKADNAKLSSLIATTRQVVAEDKAEIDQVKRDIAAKKISRQDADKKLASVDANRAQLEKTLAGLRQRQQNWREIASSERQQGTKTAALDAEIATLNKQIASMESALFELNDYRKISAVG